MTKSFMHLIIWDYGLAKYLKNRVIYNIIMKFGKIYRLVKNSNYYNNRIIESFKFYFM